VAVPRAKHGFHSVEGFSLGFPKCCDRAACWLGARRHRAAHHLPTAEQNSFELERIYTVCFFLRLALSVLGGVDVLMDFFCKQ